MKVAYYKGCLASLSAKELDTSTQALAPKVGIELRLPLRGSLGGVNR
jgi:heterodisulfide reductase subunit B